MPCRRRVPGRRSPPQCSCAAAPCDRSRRTGIPPRTQPGCWTQMVDRRRDVRACGRLHGHGLDGLAVAKAAEQLDGLPAVGEELGWRCLTVENANSAASARPQSSPASWSISSTVADERLPHGCLDLASTPGRLALARECVEDGVFAGGAEGTNGHGSMVRASTSAAVNHVGCPDERGSRAFIGVPATMLVAGGLGIIGLSIYTRADRYASRTAADPLGTCGTRDCDVRRRRPARVVRGGHRRRRLGPLAVTGQTQEFIARLVVVAEAAGQ